MRYSNRFIQTSFVSIFPSISLVIPTQHSLVTTNPLLLHTKKKQQRKERYENNFVCLCRLCGHKIQHTLGQAGVFGLRVIRQLVFLLLRNGTEVGENVRLYIVYSENLVTQNVYKNQKQTQWILHFRNHK